MMKPLLASSLDDAVRSMKLCGDRWSLAELESYIPAGAAVKLVSDSCARKLARPVDFIVRAENLPIHDLEEINKEIASYLEPISASPEETQRLYVREMQALTLFHDLVLLRAFEVDYPKLCPPVLSTILGNLADLMTLLYNCTEERADPARVMIRMASRQLAEDPNTRFEFPG